MEKQPSKPKKPRPKKAQKDISPPGSHSGSSSPAWKAAGSALIGAYKGARLAKEIATAPAAAARKMLAKAAAKALAPLAAKALSQALAKRGALPKSRSFQGRAPMPQWLASRLAAASAAELLEMAANDAIGAPFEIAGIKPASIAIRVEESPPGIWAMVVFGSPAMAAEQEAAPAAKSRGARKAPAAKITSSKKTSRR